MEAKTVIECTCWCGGRKNAAEANGKPYVRTDIRCKCCDDEKCPKHYPVAAPERGKDGKS